MCRVLGVSRSGFYAWLKRAAGAASRAKGWRRAALCEAIRRVWRASRRTYGWRRIRAALKSEGFSVGRDRLQALMRRMGIEGRIRRKFCRTTDSNHTFPVAENVLNRRFATEAPNRAWVTDITYIRTGEGWLYLAVVIDLYSRRVVGHSIQPHMRTGLVLAALRGALGQRAVLPGLVHHSDRGSQYASHAYRQMLARRGIVCSMSRRANCWDNAVAESFFSTLKNELAHRCLWRTHQEAKLAIYEFIEVFYNRQRIHSALGYLSPAEYEARNQALPAEPGVH